MYKHCLSIMNCLRDKRYIVGGEMESLYQYMSLMHVNVFNYVQHMSHAVSWWFTILLWVEIKFQHVKMPLAATISRF